MELQDPDIFDWAVSCCFQHQNSAEGASSQNPRRRDGATRGKAPEPISHTERASGGDRRSLPPCAPQQGEEEEKRERKREREGRGRKGKGGRRAEAAPPSLSGAVRRSKWPPPGRPQPAAIGAEAGCGGPCCAWGGGGGWRGPPRRPPPPGARWCRRPRRSWATRRPS